MTKFKNKIKEQLSDPDGITYRALMGEYIIYYRGKVVGDMYDEHFPVKPTKSAGDMMPETEYEELPAPKKKKGEKS